MKLIYIVLFAIMISTPSYATWVRSYIKKDGTFVSGHYRRTRGLGGGNSLRYSPNPHKGSLIIQKPNDPIFKYPLDCKNSVITTDENVLNNNGYTYIKPPKTSTPQHVNSWLKIYKNAAILNGDLSYFNKAQYISQFKEGKILEDYIRQEFIYCSEESCFVKWLSEKWHWDSINKKIDNVYNYLNQMKGKYNE